MLPDDIILIIFDFYRVDPMNYVGSTFTWHKLVHVCRRWRHLVFASPRRLDLRIVCTGTSPVSELLHVWPQLPIIIKYWLYSMPASIIPVPNPNVLTALGHHDRVREIQLSNLSQSLLDIFSTAMQEPYLSLTTLELSSDDEIAPVLPDTFSRGFAPCLQRVWLEGITFPALPTLLLSTVDLVSLLLDRIPPSTGSISPEVMATNLSALTRIKFLRIDFRSPGSAPDIRQHPRNLTRALLPCLTWLEFRGISEYLEDLLVRIEAPILDNVNIKFFNQLIFDVPQLLQSLTYSEKLNSPKETTINFHSDFVQMTLSPPKGTVGNLTLQVLCAVPLQQVSSMVQICNRVMRLLSSVERLEICGGEYENSLQEWQEDIEGSQWLDLLRPFTAVESLHVTESLGPFTASALREITGRSATEVLPALRSLFLEGLEPSEFLRGAVGQFLAARGSTNRPVAICRRKSQWDSGEHDLEWEEFMEVEN